VIVVDTSALVAILNHEPERDVFLTLIMASEVITASSCVLEAAMALNRLVPMLTGQQQDAFLATSRIGIAAITLELALAARDAFFVYGKGRHPAGLNFGDCFSYALAKELDAPLLFKGTDFGKTDVRLVTLESDRP
jgi:ribonuclease VapC